MSPSREAEALAPLSRPPCPALRPYLALVWADGDAGADAADHAQEWMLPNGAMHVVVRPGGAPLEAWDATSGFTIPNAVVGGLRESVYRKQLGAGGSVGAMLRPGAAFALLGAPASALAGRHTGLDLLWTATAAAALDERLGAARTPAHRLALFEAALLLQLRQDRPVDPAAAWAARGLSRGIEVGAIVGELGWSHRHFAARFRLAVGTTPKTFQRLARFSRALDQIHAAPATPLAEVAALHSYADQAHLTREFGAFAGLTPDRFRRLAPRQARHVPVAG